MKRDGRLTNYSADWERHTRSNSFGKNDDGVMAENPRSNASKYPPSRRNAFAKSQPFQCRPQVNFSKHSANLILVQTRNALR